MAFLEVLIGKKRTTSENMDIVIACLTSVPVFLEEKKINKLSYLKKDQSTTPSPIISFFALAPNFARSNLGKLKLMSERFLRSNDVQNFLLGFLNDLIVIA